MQETMDRTWRNLFRGTDSDGVESWAIPLDVVREGDKYTVHASLPGVKTEDIQVLIEEGVLTIKGHTQTEHESTGANYLMRERRTGSFYRALRLPDALDTDNAETYYENGALSIAFPKVDAKKAKQLTINVGRSDGVIEGEKES